MGTGTQRIGKAPELRHSSAKEQHALLQRILWSHQIKNSGRIRDFLVYVCERELQSPGVEIHEQEIGCRVFARKPDYDTAADNIVRVTASQARKKLEQYFATDGMLEPIILEIPKGKYTPVFRERDVLPSEDAPFEKSPVATTHQLPLTVVILAACAVLFLTTAIWSTLTLRRERMASRAEARSTPMVRALWLPFLEDSNRTDIVVTDSSLSLFQGLLDHQLTLAEYLKPDSWTHAEQLSGNRDLQEFAHRAAQSRFTSLASVTAADRIALLLGSRDRLSLIYPRDFSMKQMKEDNVVLLGSSRANPWTELIQERLNFRFGYDQKLKFGYFENREPQAGEPPIYRSDAGVSYCQIAYVPNLSKTGTVLAIIGTEVEGTEGGSEFATSEGSLAELRRVLPAARDGRFPYFDVLLRSNRFAGTAPPFSIVAARTLKP